MATPLDFAAPFAEVDPILEFTSISDVLRQMREFAARERRFSAGVANTSFFPFSAICKLILHFPSGTYGGTGFYIGPDLILTAGHCAFDNHSGTIEAATRMTIRPGQQRNGVHLDEFSVTSDDWTVHPRWISSNATDRGFDMTVIRVTTPPPNMEWFTLANYSPAADTPVAVCGYSGQDVASDRQHLDIDRVRRLSDNGEVVEYNLQTRRGGSGGPVFLDFMDSPGGDMPEAIPVMGVHVARGDSTHNRGVLLTPDKIDWARGGGIMSLAQSLGHQRLGGLPVGRDQGAGPTPAGVGGLPLINRSRTMMGGLPLQPAQPQMMPQSPRPQPPAATTQGHYARAMERSWIVADPDRGMSIEKRTFGKTANDLTAKTKLKVIVRNMPQGGSVRWNIPDADDRTRVMFESGSGTSQSANGTEVTLRALSHGVARVDCMVKDASGTTIESNKYVVSAPKFVRVVFDPTVEQFFTDHNLASRRTAIIDEIRRVTSMLYENVNIRFLLPGDQIPAHLDGGANAAYPGGRAVADPVSVVNVLGNLRPRHPEFGHHPGAGEFFLFQDPSPSGGTSTDFGINHITGILPAPFDDQNLVTVLLAHFRDFPEVDAVQTAIAAGGQTAANLNLAATMFGRILGENIAHEVGHFPVDTLRGHNQGATARDGLMARGSNRTFAERTGMATGTGGALLTDNGTAGINRLSGPNLHDIEDALPVGPPLDAAELRRRGRSGSFALQSQTMSGETVHLPGATVLEGWQAEMLIFAIEEALAIAASGGNPAMYVANQFIFDIDRILDACDAANVTVGLGTAFGGGVVAGATAGAGIVFAPGRRVGFYGALSGVAGAVASGGISLQFTVVRGGPENFGGSSYTAGVSVATIGWFDAGLLDIPVGAHVIFNSSAQPIGITTEVGVSVGIPGFSLVEVYGQAVWTETTIDTVQAQGLSVSASDPGGDLRTRAISRAVDAGAPPDGAADFAAQLFR